MLSIRMTRMGSKKKPYFRLVVSEGRSALQSSFVENLGTYNPRMKPAKVEINRERVQYWLKKGAKPSDSVRTLLAKFGLTAEHVLRPAATLSPGERTRAALALLQARGINVLVLDEPTNHLDLPAIEQLEQALASYEGTLLLVTHDRRMLEAVHTTRRLAVAGGRVTEE